MARKIILALAAAVLAIVSVTPALATPEKAKQTDKHCKECHPNAGPHANWYHK